jgi:hypothetical protein
MKNEAGITVPQPFNFRVDQRAKLRDITKTLTQTEAIHVVPSSTRTKRTQTKTPHFLKRELVPILVIFARALFLFHL